MRSVNMKQMDPKENIAGCNRRVEFIEEVAKNDDGSGASVVEIIEFNSSNKSQVAKVKRKIADWFFL